jgi:hypothetical protein
MLMLMFIFCVATPGSSSYPAPFVDTFAVNAGHVLPPGSVYWKAAQTSGGSPPPMTLTSTATLSSIPLGSAISFKNSDAIGLVDYEAEEEKESVDYEAEEEKLVVSSGMNLCHF